MTNQRTVPSIFVNRVHVGGCDHTFQVNSTVCFLAVCPNFVFKEIFKRGGNSFYKPVHLCLLELVKWKSFLRLT